MVKVLVYEDGKIRQTEKGELLKNHLGDAPDNNLYARRDGGWVEVEPVPLTTRYNLPHGTTLITIPEEVIANLVELVFINGILLHRTSYTVSGTEIDITVPVGSEDKVTVIMV